MNRNTTALANTAKIDTTELKNIFRITELEVTQTTSEFYIFKAEIYNKHTLLRVTWISEIKPDGLQLGDVVNIIWLTKFVFSSGTNIIFGVNKVIKLEANNCVLSTVPPSWIRNPTIFNEFVSIIRSLDNEAQHLIQQILLKSDVLYRFLTSPYQLKGPYSNLGGNIQKTVIGLRETLLDDHQQINLDLNFYLAALVILGIGRNKQYMLDKKNKTFIKSNCSNPKFEANNLLIKAAVMTCGKENKSLLRLLEMLK